MLLIGKIEIVSACAASCGSAEKHSSSEAVVQLSSLSLSGSNQAREGRLVDALAVRGDEGRDTLR